VLRCTKIVLDEEAIPTHLLGQCRQFGHSLDVDEAVEGREKSPCFMRAPSIVAGGTLNDHESAHHDFD
jgi:hypothetical protein